MLYEHARVSEGKAVAFSTMLQKKFFWFLYLKEKSKLPLDGWEQVFNLAVTLIIGVSNLKLGEHVIKFLFVVK